MKIFIVYKPKEKAWGGGNQFLRGLKEDLSRKGVVTESVAEADVIFFNGYQEIFDFIKCLVLHPRKKRIWRLGPIMSLHRSGVKWKIIDWTLNILSSAFANIVFFQSTWSLKEARKRGFLKKKNVFIINNASDSTIFYPKSRLPSIPIRLIYTSWSANPKKGFSFLKYLDKHIDTKRFAITFVGNLSFKPKTINVKSPMNSQNLAIELRNHDIFISPTKDDACSNAILEALACGLPVVALRSGGNQELVKDGGLLFSNEQEMLQAIDTVARDLDGFRGRITVKSISEVADEYMSAICDSIK